MMLLNLMHKCCCCTCCDLCCCCCCSATCMLLPSRKCSLPSTCLRHAKHTIKQQNTYNTAHLRPNIHLPLHTHDHVNHHTTCMFGFLGGQSNAGSDRQLLEPEVN
jgi:hypothetical protein